MIRRKVFDVEASQSTSDLDRVASGERCTFARPDQRSTVRFQSIRELDGKSGPPPRISGPLSAAPRRYAAFDAEALA